MRVPTILIANKVGQLLSKIFDGDYVPHGIDENSFELSLDGEKYDGGSFYIDERENLILASVTPQLNLGCVHNLKEVERRLLDA